MRSTGIDGFRLYFPKGRFARVRDDDVDRILYEFTVSAQCNGSRMDGALKHKLETNVSMVV